MMEDTSRKTILSLIGAVLLLSAALFYVLFLKAPSSPAAGQQPQDQEPQSFTSTTITADELANWKTYESSKYGFSFKYPPEYVVESQDPYYDKGENYPFHVVRVKPPRSSTSTYVLEVVVPSNREEYYLPMTGFGSRIYKRSSNRWVENNPRTGVSHALCLEKVILGSEVPAYHSVLENAGFVSDIALVITSDNFIKFTMERRVSSTPDAMMEKIASSFALADISKAIAAQCDEDKPTGFLEEGYSAPYPVTWKEGSSQFAIIGAGLGTIPAPAGLQKFSGGNYEPGQEVHVLSLQVLVTAEQDNPCVPLNMRRLINEAGDLVAPNTPQFVFKETDSCSITAGNTYEYKVLFEVPNSEKEFLITTGSRSNVFFQVNEKDGKITIENFSELEG